MRSCAPDPTYPEEQAQQAAPRGHPVARAESSAQGAPSKPILRKTEVSRSVPWVWEFSGLLCPFTEASPGWGQGGQPHSTAKETQAQKVQRLLRKKAEAGATQESTSLDSWAILFSLSLGGFSPKPIMFRMSQRTLSGFSLSQGAAQAAWPVAPTQTSPIRISGC